jgi:hypothetical protein
MGGGAEHAYAPGGVLDDGQNVLALFVEGDGLDEQRQECVGLRVQEVGPGGGRPLGCRINAFLLKDLPDHGSGDLEAERGQLAMHPPISPGRILPDQTQDERADGADRRRTPTPLRPAGTGMPPLHDLAVPAQNGVRADDKPQAMQDRSRQRGQQGSQEDTLLRSESHPGIGAELPLQAHDLVTQSENLNILVPISDR